MKKSWSDKMARRRAAGLSMELRDLLPLAWDHTMTEGELAEQRRSWVVGELMLHDSSLTREEALRRVKAAEQGRLYGGRGR